MPKPKSKTELLDLSEKNYKRLMGLIDSVDSEKQNQLFPEGSMNRNIRDVLAHLHEWHLMMLRWYEIGIQGEKPDMPAKGYGWKDTPALNRKIWKDCQSVDLLTIRTMFNESYLSVRKLIEQHSDEELFTKKKYLWTGSTSLGAYLISSTSSHYNWAYKLIRRCWK